MTRVRRVMSNEYGYDEGDQDDQGDEGNQGNLGGHLTLSLIHI